MKLFKKAMQVVSVGLILITGQAIADQATGKVSRSNSKVVFLDDASQTAVHISAATELNFGTAPGVSKSVANLKGQQIEVTYHKEGNLNIADSIVVKSQ